MPLLPTRNNLDYNTNSIINASKMIKNVALENLKNPVLDPDIKTLSSMDAEKNLKGNLEMLQQMYLDVQNDLLKLSQYTGTSIGNKFANAMMGSGMMGGVKGDMGLAGLFAEPKNPRGRPRGSKSVSAPPTASNLGSRPIESYFSRGVPSSSSSVASSSIASSSTPVSRRIARQGRFQPRLTPFETNPQGTPFGDPDDSDPDDDTASLPSSASSMMSRTNSSRSSNRSGGISANDPFEINVNSLQYILTNMIVTINSKIQKMDFFFNSRIKPAFRKLDAAQQGFLGTFLQTIYQLYNKTFREVSPGSLITTEANNLEDFITMYVESGDNLLSTLKKSIDKLILDVSIGLNASKQQSRPDQTTTINTEPADNYALQLAGFVGAGKKKRVPKPRYGQNFYGEQINDSRDIPTIWNSVRNCPTKYLL